VAETVATILRNAREGGAQLPQLAASIDELRAATARQARARE
jgi:hypothetical protein